MSVSPIPAGYPTVSPYLLVSDGVKALEFYSQAFGAVEKFRLLNPDGKIAHAEFTLGDSLIMLADDCTPNRSARSSGFPPVMLHVYVPRVDDVVSRAILAGATIVRAVQTQFYGDRSGSVTDPFGHTWNLATHVEDVSPEEMERRFAALTKESGGA